MPILILQRLNIRIIIYPDDMLLLSKTVEEVLMTKDKVIFLLQHLGCVINLKKSVLIATQKIIFLRSDSKFDQINIVTDPRDVTKNISIMLGNV